MHSGPIGAAWMMDCWGHRDPPNAIGGILAAGIPKQYSYQTCWWCDSFTCNMSASARMIFPNDTYVCCSNVYVALCHRMNLSGYIMLISAEYISQLNNQWQVRLGQQWYKKVISSRPLVIPSPLFLAGYKVLFIWKPVRMLMQWCRARTRIWSNLQTKPRPIKNMDILYSIQTAYYVVRLWNTLSMCLPLQESGFSHGGIWKPNDGNDSVLLVAFNTYSTCLVCCWLHLVSTFCSTG